MILSGAFRQHRGVRKALLGIAYQYWAGQFVTDMRLSRCPIPIHYCARIMRSHMVVSILYFAFLTPLLLATISLKRLGAPISVAAEVCPVIFPFASGRVILGISVEG